MNVNTPVRLAHRHHHIVNAVEQTLIRDRRCVVTVQDVTGSTASWMIHGLPSAMVGLVTAASLTLFPCLLARDNFASDIDQASSLRERHETASRLWLPCLIGDYSHAKRNTGVCAQQRRWS